MGCFACQTFWTAVAICAITHGVTDLPGWLFSAAAYSGAAVLMSVVYGSGQHHAPDPTWSKAGLQELREVGPEGERQASGVGVMSDFASAGVPPSADPRDTE